MLKWCTCVLLVTAVVGVLSIDLSKVPEFDAEAYREIARKKCEEYSKYAEPDDYDDDPEECTDRQEPLEMGGEKVPFEQFPHTAIIGLELKNTRIVEWHCLGTIISERILLTSGSCITKPGYLPKATMMGFKHSTIQLKDVIKYWYDTTNRFDVGLVQVERINLNLHVRPACLNTNVDFGSKAIATGYKEGLPTETRDFMKVTLGLLNKTTCSSEIKTIEPGKTIEDKWMICFKPDKEITHCKGDNGGPIQVYHKGGKSNSTCLYDIVGIQSFGPTCGRDPKAPGVYTRVSYILRWIVLRIWQDEMDPYLLK